MDRSLLATVSLILLLSSVCRGMPGFNQEEKGHGQEDKPLKFKGDLGETRPVGANDAEKEHHDNFMRGTSVKGMEHDPAHAHTLQAEHGKQEPKDPNEAIHQLMHGEEGVEKHAWDEKTPEGAEGPPNREQMLHKFMHGDEGVDKHIWDKEEAKGPDSPPDGEHLMHNLLMHGDLKHGEHQEKTEPGDGADEKLGVVPSPPTHGEHHGDPHSEKTENDQGKQSPPDAEQLMHGLVMHGDLAHEQHHEKHDKEAENTQPIGPSDAEEQFHGVLMHGDKESGHHHDHESDKTEEDNRVPSAPDYASLHGVLMHGDTELGHDHSHEDQNAVNEVFKDLSKILELELGEDLLRITNLRELFDRDRAEYAEYLASNPKSKDDATIGSTYASVPDTIFDDMELMKQRYLSKLEDDLEAAQMEAAVVDKRMKEEPFTPDDMNNHLDVGTDVHNHEDRNQHEIELIGRTDPINARHKAFQVVQENKENVKSKADKEDM